MTTPVDRYGVLLSSFFDGETGLALQQQRNWQALILAAYLTANRYANMIGLYEISLTRIERGLPILRGQAAIRKAFKVLAQLRYAYYDPDSEYVWVQEMARVRLFLVRGEPCKNSNRRLGAEALYLRAAMSPFLGPFFDRYVIELGLTARRPGSDLPIPLKSLLSDFKVPPKGLRSPSEVPLKSLRSDSEVPSESGTRKQVPDNRYVQESGKVGTERANTAAAPRRAETERVAADNVEVITTLVRKEILPQLARQTDDAELVELVKTRCARLAIAYDTAIVNRAIASARVRDLMARTS